MNQTNLDRAETQLKSKKLLLIQAKTKVKLLLTSDRMSNVSKVTKVSTVTKLYKVQMTKRHNVQVDQSVQSD